MKKILQLLLLPASLDLLFQAIQTAPPHVEPQRKLLRPASYSCQWLWICVWDFLFFFVPSSSLQRWEGGCGQRERETDKLEASKSAAALCNRSKHGVQRSVCAAGSSASGQHLVSAAREEEATEKRYSTTRLDHNLGEKGGGNTETLPSKQNLPFVPKAVCHSWVDSLLSDDFRSSSCEGCRRWAAAETDRQHCAGAQPAEGATSPADGWVSITTSIHKGVNAIFFPILRPNISTSVPTWKAKPVKAK